MDIDPAVPPALPQAPSRQFYSSHPSSSNDSPAQLALLLSDALQEADALRTQLANEQNRALNLENTLSRLSKHSDVDNVSSAGASDEAKLRRDRLAEAETRAEHAERLRDGALRALHTLKSSFADLDRYEHLLVLRAADARDAFAHSLSLLSHQVQVQAHTHSQPTHEQELPQLPPLPPPLRGAERLRDGYGNGGADAGPGGPSRPHPADRMTHPHAPAPAAAPLQPSSHAHAHGIGHGNGAHPPPTLTPASFSHGKPALASSLSTAGAEVFTSLALNLPPPPSASASTPTSKRRRHDWSSAPAAENGVDADGLKSAAATTAPRIDARQLVRESKERNRLDYARSRASNGHLLRHAEVRGVKRPRSTSHSSHGSLSLDEMLLETATPSTLDPPPHPNPLLNSSLPPPVARNAVSASGLGPTVAKPQSSIMQLGAPGSAASTITGNTQAPPAFPSHNAEGLRLCRQCGAVGRYKDKRCIEKWGPGPHGPGTVCDRCRKKQKRMERRNTLDAQAQMQSQAGNASAFSHQQALQQLRPYSSERGHLNLSPPTHSYVSSPPPSKSKERYEQYEQQSQRTLAPSLSPSRSRSNSASPSEKEQERSTPPTPTSRYGNGHEHGHGHRHTGSLPDARLIGNGFEYGYGRTQETLRSPRLGPKIGIAVSEERGRGPASANAPVFEREGEVHSTRSRAAQVQADTDRGRKRHPSPPRIESISTRDQGDEDAEDEDITSAVEASQTQTQTQAQTQNSRTPGDVDVMMHDELEQERGTNERMGADDVDTALARAVGTRGSSSPFSDLNNDLDSQHEAGLDAGKTQTPHAKLARKREKGQEWGGGGGMAALDAAEGGADSSGDGEADVDADADAEIMDAVDAVEAAEAATSVGV